MEFEFILFDAKHIDKIVWNEVKESGEEFLSIGDDGRTFVEVQEDNSFTHLFDHKTTDKEGIIEWQVENIPITDIW